MESPWLYDTAVPVLLGTAADSPAAGRLARRLFRRHQVMCWWFGQRLSLSLILYTRHRPVSLGTLNDRLRVRALRDFAAAPEQSGKLLALIPCSALSGRLYDPLEGLLMAEQPAHGAAQTEAVRS